MKKNKMLFTSLLLLLFATYSCAIEELQPEPSSFSSETLKNVNPTFLEHDLSKYKIKPIWKSAVVFKSSSANKKTKFNEAVEVNFTQDNKTTIPLSKNGKIRGRQRLLLTFDDGKIRETIIEYIPSDSYMGDIKEINSGNFKSKQFDGKITFQNPKEETKTIWYLSKGKIVKKGKSSTKKIKPSKTSRYVSVYSCHTYEVCVGPGGEEVCNDHTTCNWEEVWEEDDPNVPPPDNPYDCAIDPSWPWCQDNGGGGGDPPTDPPVVCTSDEFIIEIQSIVATSEFIGSSNLIPIQNPNSKMKGNFYSKFYTWKCMEGISYHVVSTEVATIQETDDPAFPKVYTSLTHANVSPVGVLVNGSISITSDSGIGTTSLYNATMELSIGYTLTSDCFAAPINQYEHITPSHLFNIND